MSPSVNWVRGQLWRAVLLGRGRTLQKLAWLRKAQWLTPDHAHHLQYKRLKDLLEYTYEHVPYYRDPLRAAGVFEPHENARISRFPALTPLEKADLSRNPDTLLSDEASLRRAYPNSSGGSTGVPVQFHNDAESFEWHMAGKALFDEWTGYTPGMPRVGLWGSMRDIETTHDSLSSRLGSWLRNELWLNAFLMDADRMREYLQRIERHRPVQILAYADVAYSLAQFMLQEGVRVPPPRAIMTSAGTLTPEMREVIQEAFGAPVFDRYGCREMGDIACECDRHRGLHVLSPNYLVEVVDEDGQPVGPGETGDLLVTDLTNYSQPFIRYRIGDRATVATEPCPCGRGLPTLAAIEGRSADCLVRRDGTRLSYTYPTHLVGVVLNSGWVARYQVVQESYEEVRLLLEPVPGTDLASPRLAEEVAAMGTKLESVLGEGFRVTAEIVDRIPPSASGKHRYVICKVTEGGSP